MQQIELNFVPVAELRKDTQRAIATVAHGGGNVFTCEVCGAIRPNQHPPFKNRFCSQKCYQSIHQGGRDWHNDAERLYVSESMGFKRVAKAIGKSPTAVYLFLRRKGLIDPQKHRASRPKETYKNCGRYHSGKNPVVHIRYSYTDEIKKLKRFDESEHWSNHPISKQEYNRSKAALRWIKFKNEKCFRERRKQSQKQWKQKNISRVRNARRAWFKTEAGKLLKKRQKENPVFRMRINVRRRLKDFIKGKIGIKWCTLVGCNREFFKSHIESKFQPGMTWENYGTYWHVDHRLPLSSFDLTDRAQLLASCHYTNLQPLTAFENMSKGAKLIYEKAA